MTLSILIASIFTALNPFHMDDRVATASLIFQVEDDRGEPVTDAKVDVFFDMMYDQGQVVSSSTDSNGTCRVSGKTVGIMEYKVSRDGYYGVHNKIVLLGEGSEHKKEKGKWLPWGMAQRVILPKARNRVAIPFKSLERKWTKHINEWIGYDLILSDYVEPFGSGKISDFEIKFDWDGKQFNEYNGIEIDLRFPEQYAGIYWADKFAGSELKGVYEANKLAKYEKQISFGERVYRNERGEPTNRESKQFDKSKTLVGRSRCVVNENGELTSAIYFQIYYMAFSCDKKGVAIRCGGFYNPTPNDTNIEPR